MKQQYYAIFEGFPQWVYIFDSEEYRDKWIAYEDDMSQMFPETRDCGLERVSITEEEADDYSFGLLHEPDAIYPDELDDKIKWVSVLNVIKETSNG